MAGKLLVCCVYVQALHYNKMSVWFAYQPEEFSEDHVSEINKEKRLVP